MAHIILSTGATLKVKEDIKSLKTAISINHRLFIEVYVSNADKLEDFEKLGVEPEKLECIMVQHIIRFY